MIKTSTVRCVFTSTFIVCNINSFLAPFSGLHPIRRVGRWPVSTQGNTKGRGLYTTGGGDQICVCRGSENGVILNVPLKPIFHYDTKYLASGVGVGQCPRGQNFALEIPTCWYILALPNAKICVFPDANPQTPVSRI